MRPLPVLALALVLGAGACAAQGPPARVGSVVVSERVLERELSDIEANEDYVRHMDATSRGAVLEDGGFSDTVVAGVLSRRIHYTVVAAEVAARELNITDDHRERGRVSAQDDVDGAKLFAGFPKTYRAELVRRGALVATLADDVVADETVERYYARHRDDFLKACGRHLLVATRKDAEAARARVVGGESFASVAMDVSLDEGTKPLGGNLYCNAKGDLVGPLDRAAFSQDVGDVGQPIATPEGGWQILLVESRRTPALTGIRGEVQAAISELAQRRVGEALIERFGRTDIEVDPAYGTWDAEQRKVVVS